MKITVWGLGDLVVYSIGREENVVTFLVSPIAIESRFGLTYKSMLKHCHRF